MSIIPTLKSVGVWCYQFVMLPPNLAKVAQMNRYWETLQKLAEVENRLKEAKEELAGKEAVESKRMFFSGNVYWSKDADNRIENVPYCAAHFELYGKRLHLLTRKFNPGTVMAYCPVCKTEEFEVILL